MSHTQWPIQDFPLGGAPTHWGGADLRRIHFSVKTYAKTKEMNPVGGGGGHVPVAPLDLPMTHVKVSNTHWSQIPSTGI